MKRLFRIIAVLSLSILVACGNTAYDEAIENGEVAAEKDRFEEAQSYFKEALEAKKNDESAAIYLTQTNDMIESLNFLEEGELAEAEKHLESVKQEEQGLDVLHNKADAKLKELGDMKDTYKEVEQLLVKVQQAKETGHYEEAEEYLNQIEKLSLDHVYYKPLHDQAVGIKEEIEAYVLLKEELASQYEQAKSLMEEQKHGEAMEIIKESLAAAGDQPAAQEIKVKVEKLESDIKIKQQNAENAKKKQEIINSIKGYWKNTDLLYHYCHFTDTSYICLTEGSDEFYFDDITKWDADIENGLAIAHFPGGRTFEIPVHGDKMRLNNGEYVRMTKEAVQSDLNGGSVDDFFDIEKFKNLSNY